jgi:hypothetical protein
MSRSCRDPTAHVLEITGVLPTRILYAYAHAYAHYE